MVQLSQYMTTGKTTALTIWTFVTQIKHFKNDKPDMILMNVPEVQNFPLWSISMQCMLFSLFLRSLLLL